MRNGPASKLLRLARRYRGCGGRRVKPFRVFIGFWVDYRDVYYESSFWLGPCEVGTYLAPGGGVPDDGFDGDRARLSVADKWCCEGLDDAVVSSSPGGTVQAAAEGMEWF